jgi:hypothetical protein
LKPFRAETWAIGRLLRQLMAIGATRGRAKGAAPDGVGIEIQVVANPEKRSRRVFSRYKPVFSVPMKASVKIVDRLQ